MPGKSQKKGGSASADSDHFPFNAKDLKFIKSVMDNMPGKPDSDWGQVATAIGYKNAKQAQEKFRVMSIKYGWQGKDAPEKPAQATVGDARFVKAVFDAMSGRPDANWEQVAVDYGCKDKKQAMEKYRVMAIKFNWPRGPVASSSRAKGGKAQTAGAKALKGKKRSFDEVEDSDGADTPSDQEEAKAGAHVHFQEPETGEEADVSSPSVAVRARLPNGRTPLPNKRSPLRVGRTPLPIKRTPRAAAAKAVNYADADQSASSDADDDFVIEPKARAPPHKRAKLQDDRDDLDERNDLALLEGPLFPNLVNNSKGPADSVAGLAGGSNEDLADDEQSTGSEKVIPSVEKSEDEYDVV